MGLVNRIRSIEDLSEAKRNLLLRYKADELKKGVYIYSLRSGWWFEVLAAGKKRVRRSYVDPYGVKLGHVCENSRPFIDQCLAEGVWVLTTRRLDM